MDRDNNSEIINLLNSRQTIKHNIEPVFDKSSRILLLGSFPSPKSRETCFYYGNPRNRMWQVLSNVLDEPLPLSKEDKRKMLLSNRIAMWDVLAECEITGAADQSIRNEKPNNLNLIFDCAEIRAVFLAGTKAYLLYKKIFSSQISIPYFKLPSTSPANAGISVQQLICQYKVIGDYL